MSKHLTMGSLFDGIAGFPLAASRYGIETVWASEIEPNCIKITSKHFPKMKHLGDVANIPLDEIAPVDIVTFGSPCQDLSVAGKRAGLDGERSGLFRIAVDLIRRLRARDGKPEIVVWENVPGAFSSNKGMDFREVLKEITEAEIPMPADGRWAPAGVVECDNCQLSWRVLDAQYWGVPQRRKRIFLVADFRGKRSTEILFKPDCLRRNNQESRSEREGFAGEAGKGVEATMWDGDSVCPTLSRSNAGGGQRMPDKANFNAILQRFRV